MQGFLEKCLLEATSGHHVICGQIQRCLIPGSEYADCVRCYLLTVEADCILTLWYEKSEEVGGRYSMDINCALDRKAGTTLSEERPKISVAGNEIVCPSWPAYADSIMKVPPRIFISTVFPASPFVFLRTRHFMSVVEVFRIPSSTLHEFSRLPDSFPS